MISRICRQCHKSFQTYPSYDSKFCGNGCYGMNQRRRVPKVCQTCGKEFEVSQSRKDAGKFCSAACFHSVNIPWNKGKHIRTNSGRTHFKKGKNMETEHHAWKGDDVGYASLHDWVYSRLGRPTICEHCGKSGLSGRQIHWANKSGKYLRDVSDWLRLCVKCHKAYDSKLKNIHG